MLPHWREKQKLCFISVTLEVKHQALNFLAGHLRNEHNAKMGKDDTLQLIKDQKSQKPYPTTRRLPI